jgi:hypothetical protein
MPIQTKRTKTKPTPVLFESIERRIYLIRGEKVMLDVELATLYGVATKNLNKAVRRNLARFPGDFMFQLTEEEVENLRFQFGTSRWGGRRYRPYAFTEHGVAMLSSVLNSPRAVQVNLSIIRAFIRLRGTLATHKDLARTIEELQRQQKEHGERLGAVYSIVQSLVQKATQPKKRIGYITSACAR